jgi:hypothetical protein
VTELVHEDEQAERDQERDDGDDGAGNGHLAYSFAYQPRAVTA